MVPIRNLQDRRLARSRCWFSVLAFSAFAAVALFVAPAARADHPTSIDAFSPEGEVRFEVEAQALGSGHAREHARGKNGISRADTRGEVTRVNRRKGGKARQVGRWTKAYFRLPTYAIHAAMLPTGKVLFWGYPAINPTTGLRGNGGQAALWDPSKGTGSRSIRKVPPPWVDPDGSGPAEPGYAPIYCSGQSHLPTGDILATGGNLVWPEDYANDVYTDFVGLDMNFTFDPFSETWTTQPKMRDGRWYPSQVRLADQRTAIIGGYSAEAPGGINNTDVEIFAPGPGLGELGSISLFGESLETGLYPHLYSLPDRKVLVNGPSVGDSHLIDFFGGSPKIEKLRPIPDGRDRNGSNGLLIGGGPGGSFQTYMYGGYNSRRPANPGAPKAEHRYPAISKAYGFDADREIWTTAPAFNVPRSYANTVLLPNGAQIAIGGGDGRNPGFGLYKTTQPRKRVEILNNPRGKWRLGPSQREFRSYHSTGVLLPDGRIFSAGDDAHPYTKGAPQGLSRFDTAEIYKPPYLYLAGKRPRINRVPRNIRYGDDFGVRTSNGAAKAVLMSPAAVTHANDMSQRRIPLKVIDRAEGNGLNLVAPKSGAVAPEGFYMLFVMRPNGKPSVAKWVHIAEYHSGNPTL